MFIRVHLWRFLRLRPVPLAFTCVHLRFHLGGEHSGFRVLGGESAVLRRWLILLLSSLVAAFRGRARKKVPGSIAELDGRFERNLSACGHAQADRGESLDVGYDSQPRMTALPVFPTISRLVNEETSK